MFKAAVSAWVVCVVLIVGLASRSGFSQDASRAEHDCKFDQGALPTPRGDRPRVAINLKTSELEFARSNKVPLDLHRQAVREMSLSWDSLWGVLAPLSSLVLEHDPDGSAFVEVVPIGIGKLKLDIGFIFEDCSIDEQRVDVNVAPPERDPEKLILTWTNWQHVREVGTAHLDFADFSSVVMTPLAFYHGIDSPVPILGEYVSYTVITRNKEDAPIAIDSSFAAVKSVKVGQALIKATFHGVSGYTCMDVMRDARMTTGRLDCHDFLPLDLIEPMPELKHPPSGQAPPH